MTREDQVKAAAQASLQMELNRMAEVIDVDCNASGGEKMLASGATANNPSSICPDSTGGDYKIHE